MSVATRFGLLAALYFSQGLPYGFFTKGLGALLRDTGLSLPDIGLASLLFLPWALKFLPAPLVDRFGRRKQWIVPLQLLAAGALVALSQLDIETDLRAILWLVVLINAISATQDIATDGLAVSLLRPEDRGLGNAVQVGGYRIGMIVGGGALLVAYVTVGWQGACLIMAGLIAVASIPVIAYREPARPPRPPATAGSLALATIDFVRRPGAPLWLLLLLAYKTFDALAGPMISPMMIDMGYGVGEVGVLAGTAGSVAGLVGAIVGGVAAQRLGRVRALIWLGLLQVLAVGLYALPAAGIGGAQALLVGIVADSLLGGAATVALFTAMMDVCRPATEASDYTIQACVIVILTGTASGFSGYLAEGLGYRDHFLLTGALTFAGWLLTCAVLRAGVFDRLRVADPRIEEAFE